MKCRHPKRAHQHYIWRVGGGDIKTWFNAASWEEPGLTKCSLCGDDVSLGPANDSGPHAETIRIEQRAAEIARVDGFGYWRPGLTSQEVLGGCGWNCAELGFADTWCSGDPDCLAGYLAWQIVNHTEKS